MNIFHMRAHFSFADQLMASPAWLPQEMQTSASQASVPASGSSMPTSATGPLVGARTSTLNGGTGPASSPSFSYNVFPNVGTGSGSSQLLSSSPVSNSSPFFV